MRCAVSGCNHSNYKYKKKNVQVEKNIKFFSFPKKNEFIVLWKKACNRKKDINPETARICSNHFQESDFTLKYKLGFVGSGRLLNEDAVPSLNLPNTKTNQSTTDTDRKIRLTKRNRRIFVKEILDSTPSIQKPKPQPFELIVIPGSDKQLECEGKSEELETGKPDLQNQSEELKFNELQNTFVQVPNASDFVETKLQKLNEEIKQNKQLIEKLQYELNVYKKAVNNVFTPGQSKKFLNPEKRIIWSIEDLTNALTIYLCGRRSYEMLLQKNFPLPSISTLKVFSTKSKKLGNQKN